MRLVLSRAGTQHRSWRSLASSSHPAFITRRRTPPCPQCTKQTPVAVLDNLAPLTEYAADNVAPPTCQILTRSGFLKGHPLVKCATRPCDIAVAAYDFGESPGAVCGIRSPSQSLAANDTCSQDGCTTSPYPPGCSLLVHSPAAACWTRSPRQSLPATNMKP